MDNITVNRWMKEYEKGIYNIPSKALKLCWTDWWCSDKALIKANKKVYNTLKKITKAKIINPNNYKVRIANQKPDDGKSYYMLYLNSPIKSKCIALEWGSPYYEEQWGIYFGKNYKKRIKKASIYDVVDFLKKNLNKKDKTKNNLNSSQIQILKDIKTIKSSFERIYEILNENVELANKIYKTEGNPLSHPLDEDTLTEKVNTWGKTLQKEFSKLNKEN
jgi:hypothetical protein